MEKDCTVIIRESGERTLALCQQLAKEQVLPENVLTIREVPFARAVQRTFEIGLERGLTWTLALDADILIHSQAISELMVAANQLEPQVFEIQANILDKFFAFARPGGYHLYRTALCEKALAYISEIGDSRRPETFVIKAMNEAGYPWEQLPFVIGLHDYEQYYRDIYRKAYTHAHKHAHYSELLETLWKRLAPDDPDYQVAWWGLRAGQIFKGEFSLDVRQFPRQIDALLQMQNLQEKEELFPGALTSSQIAHIIDTFVPPSESQQIAELVEKRQTSAFSKKLQYAFDEIGWLKFLPWLAGAGMEKIGAAIVKWAKK